MLGQSRPPGPTYPPRSQREPQMLSPMPAAERASERAAETSLGSTPPSWLITPELRLQPPFFPTCTGAGTSAAAVGSRCQRGGHQPSVVFLRGGGRNCSHGSVGSPRYLSGLRGLGEKQLKGDFRDFGDAKDQPEGCDKVKPGGSDTRPGQGSWWSKARPWFFDLET